MTRRPRTWEVRESALPRASFEETEIRTADGVSLRAVVNDPPAGVALLGTCVLAHAMFARKSEWGRRDRPGVADVLAALGHRTIAFDFRGHGDSAMPNGGSWGYDDLVRLDLPAVVECARARSDGKPVLVVGHSLGAHVALAAQGTGAMAADAVVSIAGNVWLRELEPSRVRWAAKVALMRAFAKVTPRAGRFPARALRMGSDDESAVYVGDLVRMVERGAWRSADGREDYLASLANVLVPVASVASEGDRINCHADCAEAFARRCGGPVRIVRVTRSDDGGAPPGHMEIVTTNRARSAVLAAVRWAHEALG